ncbi:GIY-YIG nuclease family protein [Nostoc sp.]|uniref:GIY-YIG nuclease family protein n=1 Tax=Nostoc sp. TaxID=1180 RepID=UPI002FF9482E
MTYTADELNQTGIYVIINRDTGKRYIGSTTASFRRRWDNHKRSLRTNKHHSTKLQRAWNKYTEFRFEFKIIEVVPKEEWTDNKYLLDIEQMYLDTYQPEYNICKTAGSNLGLKRSKETIEKGRASLKNYYNNNNSHLLGKSIPPEQAIKSSLTQRPQSYSFMHKVTLEVCVINNLSLFCRERLLDKSNMSKVANGRIKSYKGWICGN